MAAAVATRRRKMMGQRRRVEDEGEDEAGVDVPDLDDDSLTDGSIGSDDNDVIDDSDTSNIDEMTPTSPNTKKSETGAVETAVQPERVEPNNRKDEPRVALSNINHTSFMLNGLSLPDPAAPVPEIDYDEAKAAAASKHTSEPVVASASAAEAALPDQQAPLPERQRREHDEYRRKRDEDPAFVPNRGAFFMHDHRHAGPAANGFRPFGRPARGRGRAMLGGLYHAMSRMPSAPSDPLTTAPWTHDMHDAHAESRPARPARRVAHKETLTSSLGYIKTASPSDAPINRAMSTEKAVGSVTIRVFMPPMKTALAYPGVTMMQYTKLPDHRPPLRRDKPVRVSLPYHGPVVMPRYIFPPSDRSFIFIPRALRPNQQARGRNRVPRSAVGSMEVFSRRTSVLGGSYYGSTYSPSIALSRRSSIAPDMGRDFLFSPTSSAISRPPMPMDKVVTVRLPPPPPPPPPALAGSAAPRAPDVVSHAAAGETGAKPTINEVPPPQTHPLPQKPPTFQENQSTIPTHQPRPQETLSVGKMESPTPTPGEFVYAYQTAFHQQMPPQVSSGGMKHESHIRRPSYPQQHSTGTPLSQIPERAIHAAPFQPTAFPQPPHGFYPEAYPMVPNQQAYYYHQAYPPALGPVVSAPAFVPSGHDSQTMAYAPALAPEPAADAAPGGQASGGSRLISQDIGGTMYYFDPSQLPPMATYPPYAGGPGYVVPGYDMNGMVAPTPDMMYYPQPVAGMAAGVPDYSHFNYAAQVPGISKFPQ